MLQHMGVTVYECSFKYSEVDLCEAVFRNEHDLQEHKCKHNGQEPFVCSFEGCGFASALFCKWLRIQQCEFRRQIPDFIGWKPAEIEMSTDKCSPKSSRLDAEAAGAFLADLKKGES